MSEINFNMHGDSFEVNPRNGTVKRNGEKDTELSKLTHEFHACWCAGVISEIDRRDAERPDDENNKP